MDSPHKGPAMCYAFPGHGLWKINIQPDIAGELIWFGAKHLNGQNSDASI